LPSILQGIAGFTLIAALFLWSLGRPFWHRVRAALPLVGKLWQWSAQQELAGTLTILLRQRLPLPEAFSYAANMIGDQNLAQACRVISRQVESGIQMSDALADSIHFDRLLTSLVRSGEEQNLPTEALAEADRFFGQCIENQAAYVRRIIPPLTLIVVIGLVGLVVGSLFFPMVSLVNGLS
ncbi:MAG: type II secretion system F family protein, partial [Gammaproteobacteria bacterium]|nr:type II secretion system F family protein [Gammaproteobacteria bacterium]